MMYGIGIIYSIGIIYIAYGISISVMIYSYLHSIVGNWAFSIIVFDCPNSQRRYYYPYSTRDHTASYCRVQIRNVKCHVSLDFC